MGMSGVAVCDEVVESYQNLKLGHKHKFVVFKLNDDLTEVVVDFVADANATYDDFVGKLPENDCRYIVYDFEYDAGEGKRNKILFVVWAPDTAKIKSKMLYASTKDSVRKKLVGIGAEVQATDLSEIDYDTVFEKVNAV
mmetsp:Transcript_31080/g.88711  ORF Transcript_31080/g.88711 Transcript_31080/m.88711 type:complete len:139 (+) Transcript_31080:68-484(+)